MARDESRIGLMPVMTLILAAVSALASALVMWILTDLTTDVRGLRADHSTHLQFHMDNPTSGPSGPIESRGMVWSRPGSPDPDSEGTE